MKSLWSDAEAEAAIRRYGEAGIPRALALRVYTTRLLGADPRLVLHGGGNTSLKTRMTDVLGDEIDVLCVKGSGWDMAKIEPSGLPAVRLAALRRLEALDRLSDENMVNAQRSNLLDAQAPTPSVETLLHAFLPHKFVDHTHADAVLALTDQPDGWTICADLYEGSMALVPYIAPGFALAKAVAAIYRRDPRVEGVILMKHGIFTFGEDARDSYERMIAKVTCAEERIGRARRRAYATAAIPNELAPAHLVAPILRGFAARAWSNAPGSALRFVLEHRESPATLAYVARADLARLAAAGPVTPDHVIRTKPWPLVVAPPKASDLARWAAETAVAFAAYMVRYRDYFARNNARLGGIKTPLDPVPRVILVPGLGLFALAKSAREAKIAADLAETTAAVVTEAEANDRFESISEAEIFDMEYWSLEQAKLGKDKESCLARHVVVVTGGASGIGFATAAAFKRAGADLAILDRDGTALRNSATKLGALPVECDVTDQAAITAAFAYVVRSFGGVDIVVSNAGAAFQGRIGDVAEDVLRKSFELNFWAHQRVAQAALAVMRAQGIGGVLLFNTSKQAVNPGPDFGPYGLPKAATLSLMRQYALDHGREGIRANAVNADRIRSGLLTDAVIASRAKSRGVSEAEYLSGNLLKREVTAEDVAEAFLALALAEKTTAAVLTVDGGNIEAALR